MTVYRGGGYGPAVEQGETALEESLVVVVVLESNDGDRGVSKEKFSSNIFGKEPDGRDRQVIQDMSKIKNP